MVHSTRFLWNSAAGHARIIEILAEHGFTPRDFQLECSVRTLDGQDVICITATGSGKSALIYIPLLVESDSITVLVEPTNFLEGDITADLHRRGLSAVAINSETLQDARLEGRDLWKECMKGTYRAISVSPELLQSPEFTTLIKHREFRSKWRYLHVDEVHCVDEWSNDFREAYRQIWRLRSKGPKDLVVVGTSATLEPGPQTDRVLRYLGFTEGEYHLDRRDCERKNVDLIFRRIEHAYSGHEFHDLDHLIPEDLDMSNPPPKRLILAPGVELGHKMAQHLRSRLPLPMQSPKERPYQLIRHVHSRSCPECKKDAINAVYEKPDDRHTLIVVSTAVLEMGIDPPDITEAYIFTLPSTLSGVLQYTGRLVRGIPAQGKGYVYVTQKDCNDAWMYITSPNGQLDPRLLAPSDGPPVAKVPLTIPDEGKPQKKGKKKGKEDVTSVPLEPEQRRCTALLLVVAAFVQGLCITQQINMIYKNPATDSDCGRCSSCRPDQPPSSSTSTSTLSAAGLPASRVVTPRPLNELAVKPNTSEILIISGWLRERSTKMRRAHPQPDYMLVSTVSWLPDRLIKKLASGLHNLTSKEELHKAMTGWVGWELYGDQFWKNVNKIRMHWLESWRVVDELAKAAKRADSKRKKDEQWAVTKEAAGLTNVKRIKLIVPAPTASTPASPGSSNILTNSPRVNRVQKRRADDDTTIIAPPSFDKPSKVRKEDVQHSPSSTPAQHPHQQLRHHPESEENHPPSRTALLVPHQSNPPSPPRPRPRPRRRRRQQAAPGSTSAPQSPPPGP